MRQEKAWLRTLTAVLLTGLFLRLFLASRPLDILDRLFVPDDTYYTLSVARSLADGTGPSVQPPTLTNGFQPLWGFVLVPVFWMTEDVDAPLRVAAILAVLLGSANAILLARLAFRLGGPGAAIAAAVLWSLSSVAVATELGALETSLALTTTLALVEVWLVARTRPTLRRFFLAGLVAGCALLTRIDAAFLVALLGLVEIGRRNLRGALSAALGAALVVAPWWIYSAVEFGSVVPQSAAAVKEQIAFHQAAYLTVPKQIAWGIGALVGPPFLELPRLQEWLFQHTPVATGLAIAALAAGGLGVWRLLRGRIDRAQMGALFLHPVLLTALYVFHLPALWFFRRYLHVTHAVIALFLAVGIGSAWGRRTRVRGAWIVLALAASAVAVSTSQLLGRARMDPATSPDEGLHGAKGYREAAGDILAACPAGSVLGAFQSGALAYYAGPNVRVINLDGVVNPPAAQAVRNHRLGDYARSAGMTHFADWEINYRALAYFGGDIVRAARLERVAEARRQGPDSFRLTRVTWP